MLNNIKKECKHSQKKKLRGGFREDFHWCKTCGALQVIDTSGWSSTNPKERRTIYGEWELPGKIRKLAESEKKCPLSASHKEAQK